MTAPVTPASMLRRSSPALWLLDPEMLFLGEASIVSRVAPAIRVRDAVAADAPAIAAIARVGVPEAHKDFVDATVMRAIVEQTYALPALRDCIGRCSRANDAHFLVAERDGVVAGYLHYDCEGPEPELHRIYVDAAQKRRRIGSALVHELHARLAPGRSYILMVVAANRPAVAFYQHHGLIEAARVDGVAYNRDYMGVDFPPGTPAVPAFVLRFTKNNSTEEQRC
jgi:ribosomal protein S18 acetylase RimI-like enzyme